MSTRWIWAWLLFVVCVALVGLVLGPGVGSRRSPPRVSSLNNLHNHGVGLRLYAESNEGRLPRGTLASPEGVALHGWPAELLPHLDARGLHRAIDFEKPWDDPANAEAMQVELDVYLHPGEPSRDASGRGLMHFAANARVLGEFESPTLQKIEERDGLSHTLIFGEIDTSYQPWGYPYHARDPARGIGRSADRFGSPHPGSTVGFLFADGAARPISADIDPRVLRALSTWDGEEEIDPNAIR